MRSNFAHCTAIHPSRSVGESAGPPVPPPGQEQCPSESIGVGTHFVRRSVMGYEPRKATANRRCPRDMFWMAQSRSCHPTSKEAGPDGMP